MSQGSEAAEQMKVFPIQGEYLKAFAAEARKYGILFSVIKDNKAEPPTFDILARAEDVSKINRVLERIGYPAPKEEQVELKKLFHKRTDPSGARMAPIPTGQL